MGLNFHCGRVVTRPRTESSPSLLSLLAAAGRRVKGREVSEVKTEGELVVISAFSTTRYIL